MMEVTDFAIRLSIAFGAGLLIGLERQWKHKSAGLRTNILVAIGSALYVLLSVILTEEKGDVTRIVGQVVTGVGFLGAGIIFKEGLNIHGLTTAATVWCSSAIGCVAATGLYYEAAIGTGFILIVNLVLMPLDNLLSKKED